MIIIISFLKHRILHRNLLKASLVKVINCVSSLQTIVAYLGMKLVRAISPKLPSGPIKPTFIRLGYL